MTVAHNQGLFLITAEQREELQSWAQSRSLRAGFVFRARLILSLGEGKTYREIENSFGASAPTVSKWKGQFEPGDGRVAGTAQRQHAAQRDADGAGARDPARAAEALRWLDALGGAQTGRSYGRRVHRVLAQAKLQPHRLERYMASNDPAFEEKAADIIGLYVNPPQHAAVFSVDEKTIQGLDRLDPVLPLSPGRAERHAWSSQVY